MAKTELKLIDFRVQGNKVVFAKIQAPSSETAIAYFKGRFDKRGVVVKKARDDVHTIGEVI